MAYSYELFPQKENEVWIRPNFQDYLFNKDEQHEATFNKPISTPLLEQLTDQTEQEACKQNKVGTNIKRRNYYFYKYLNLYHKAALKNSEIEDLTKQQAIDKLLTKVIDTFMLARVITYFDIIENRTASYPEIVKYFKDEAYPSANILINEKFKNVICNRIALHRAIIHSFACKFIDAPTSGVALALSAVCTTAAMPASNPAAA